jgi:APA family basic amino acid/polyamine antiporter
MSRLLRIKPMSMLTEEAGEVGENTLKRSLSALNLITLGIGAIIGAGIFVLTGKAAALHAGPAVALSFVLAGIVCAFAGLCYAEFASIIPIAGSAYTYGYATLGELVAWIIGWDLVLEYAFGAATVASGWSGYLNSLLQQLHIHIPPRFTAVPGTNLYLYQDKWQTVTSLPAGVNLGALDHVTAICNLVAMLGILIITTILVIGIKESANFNSAIVIVKLGIVGVFLAVGGWFLMQHPHLAWANWHPFVPPAIFDQNVSSLNYWQQLWLSLTGHTQYGWMGIATGASSIFFAYIGFDAVSTAAQEAKNPKRDMPIGILGSLVVCTILYILVSTVLTGLVKFDRLNVGDPVALGIDATGVSWGSLLVKTGAVFGLATVMLVMLLGQSRVFFSMSKDGLLPKWASAIHPKFRTPWISTIVVGSIVAVMPGFVNIDILSDLVNIGTLLAFTIVCAGVWVLRVRQPELERPFKTPFVPLVPILGIVTALFVMSRLPWITWMVMLGWLDFGLHIYVAYSCRHSKVQKLADLDAPGASGRRESGLLSFSGRIGRGAWWGRMVLIGGSGFIFVPLAVLAHTVSSSSPILGTVLALLLFIGLLGELWFMVATHVQRSHDLGFSGWMTLLTLVGVWYIWLGFVKGTAGANRYELTAAVD